MKIEKIILFKESNSNKTISSKEINILKEIKEKIKKKKWIKKI